MQFSVSSSCFWKSPTTGFKVSPLNYKVLSDICVKIDKFTTYLHYVKVFFLMYILELYLENKKVLSTKLKRIQQL